MDSRKATVARPLADIADRGQQSGRLLWILAGSAVLATFSAVAAMEKWTGGRAPSPTPPPLHEAKAATTADFTTVAIAPGAGEVMAVAGTSGAASVDPADVDGRRRLIESLLARRFLTLDDAPAVKADLDEEDLARQDGLLQEAQRDLSDAETRIAATEVTYQLVAAKFDRVSRRQTRVAGLPGVPADELAASLDEVRTLLHTTQISAANEALYRLDRRMDEFER